MDGTSLLASVIQASLSSDEVETCDQGCEALANLLHLLVDRNTPQILWSLHTSQN